MLRVEMTHEAFLKMRYFVEECHEEISGFGKCKPEKFLVTRKNEYGVSVEEEVSGLLVYDIEILPQTVSGAHSSIDEEELVRFLTEKTMAGESTKPYKVWWHSHVNMQAFFSTTDTGTIEQSTGFPYLLSIVTNKPGDIQTRLDIFGDLPQKDIKVEFVVQQPDNKRLRAWVKEEIADKVTFSHYVASYVYDNGDMDKDKEDDVPRYQSYAGKNGPVVEEITPEEEEEALAQKYGDGELEVEPQRVSDFPDWEDEELEDEAAVLAKTGGQRGW